MDDDHAQGARALQQLEHEKQSIGVRMQQRKIPPSS